MGQLHVKEEEKQMTRVIKPPPSKSKKPPIGITPLWLHKEQRLEELRRAIRDYCNANKPIPVEWVTEYNDLIK